MIETKILQFLHDAGIVAHVQRPEREPKGPYCIIERTGGGRSNHIKESTIAIQSYDKTLAQAAKLSAQVEDLMLYELISDPDISAARLNGSYNYTDPETKRYRYQAVFEIYHY